MASPFKVFRKHQKVMLALLAILAMFGFVILPIVLRGMGSRKITNPRVVTTTRYGDLRESDLEFLRRQRQTTLRFVGAMGEAVVRAGGKPQPFERIILSIGSTADEELVESWLLARRAEELGLVVDDKTIDAFITYLAQQRLTKTDEDDVICACFGIPLDLKPQVKETKLARAERQLFSALEEELLALRVKQMFNTSLSGMTPAQRWDYFQRLERKVTIESVPVRVADFVDRVEAPDESTLQAFFDKYKAEPYNPTSPEPGFREPPKVDVEYLKAEYQKFFDLERKAVSKEEIKQYYDEHKEDYRQKELPKPKEDEAEGLPAEESGPKSKQQRTVGPKLSPDDEAPTEDLDSKSEEAESPAKSPADSPPRNEKQPAETEPAEEAAAGSTDEEDTASTEPSSPFRLSSFLRQDAEGPLRENAEEDETSGPVEPLAESDRPAPEGSVEKPAVEPAPTPQPAVEATASEQPPAQPKPAEQPQAEPAPQEKGAAEAPGGKAPPVEAPQVKQPAAEAAEEDQPAGSAKEAPDESVEPTEDVGPPKAEPQDDATAQPRYLPLEEVEEEIGNQLARERTSAKIERLTNELQSKLSGYYDELVSYEVLKSDKEAGELLTPPTRPDFRALAKQHEGLTAHQTGLISVLETLESDIGKSFVRGEVPFVRYAFEEQRLPQSRQAVSHPAISKDALGQGIGNYYYVFWKVGEAEERIPKFEDMGVRERVLRQWKTIQARSRAKDEAEGLAAEAAEAGKPLKEVFADRSEYVVTESEVFTWLTYGGLPAWMARGRPEISEVTGVEMAGNEFMRAVFSLQKGEVATAVNDPQTVVYVVRISESHPLPKVLWDMFVSERYPLYLRAAWPDRLDAQNAWLDQIKAEAGFQWDPEWPRQSPLSRAGYP